MMTFTLPDTMTSAQPLSEETQVLLLHAGHVVTCPDEAAALREGKAIERQGGRVIVVRLTVRTCREILYVSAEGEG